MYQSKPNRHELSLEVAQRLGRLSEEVRGRLLEIALITARAASVDLPNSSAIKFAPHPIAQEADAGAGSWMEIIEVEAEDGQVYTACYGVVDGVAFAESPCGAA
jgi:hypothetical protein